MPCPDTTAERIDPLFPFWNDLRLVCDIEQTSIDAITRNVRKRSAVEDEGYGLGMPLESENKNTRKCTPPGRDALQSLKLFELLSMPTHPSE